MYKAFFMSNGDKMLHPRQRKTKKSGATEIDNLAKKVLLLTSPQVLTQAKTAITSWMLSVCFTSIASWSLLPCPWDIGRIFHSAVEDWHQLRKGDLSGIENG